MKDTDKTEGSIRHQDPPGVVNNTSNIARRANRCLQKAQQEADNSEDLPFVDRINNALRNLRPSKGISSLSHCFMFVCQLCQCGGCVCNIT